MQRGGRITGASVSSSSADVPAENTKSRGIATEGLERVVSDDKEDFDDTEWEDGSIPLMDSACHHTEDTTDAMTIEFSSPDSSKRKPVRRYSAEEKVKSTSLIVQGLVSI